MALNGDLPEFLNSPPADLSAEMKEFWLHTVAGNYDAQARTLLNTYCRVTDRLGELDAEIRTKGYYYTDRFGREREHDRVKVYARLVNEQGKLFRLLGWDQAPPDGAQGTLFL
jgi:hypothetical protein